MSTVKKRIVHPTTQKPLSDIYVNPKGWFRWNNIYHVYNSLKNYEQLQESDIPNILFSLNLESNTNIDDSQKVYRIWDPVEQKFCSSGRSMYANNGRSIWMTKGAATMAKKTMPKHTEIKEYILIETTKENE